MNLIAAEAAVRESETRNVAARRQAMGPSAMIRRVGSGIARVADDVRCDEDGSTTLMAAMMVFLVTIFGLIALNTNKVIYNRIQAQNAADSAADAAALWQARGCNVLQHLNNIHYTFDVMASTAESVSAAACGAAAVFQGMIDSGFPPTVAAGVAGKAIACPICLPLPIIDAVQQLFYTAIKPIRQAVVWATPPIAFAAANASAKGSMADGIVEVIGSSLSRVAAGLGLPGLPTSGNVSFPGVDGLLFALPLDPSSLLLHVEEKAGKGLPWKYPSYIGDVAEVAGDFGCGDVGFSGSMSLARGMGWDGDWGWNDTYAFGNPGYMTWIAGKTRDHELLNLGTLKWLNGKRGSDEEITRMHTGNPRGSEQLEIPGILAIASSQVEGVPVISHGSANARGKLIKVYFPGQIQGESFWIWH